MHELYALKFLHQITYFMSLSYVAFSTTSSFISSAEYRLAILCHKL